MDLSGAKDPNKRQLALIEKLTNEVSVNLQVGGGIRTKEEIQALLDCGSKACSDRLFGNYKSYALC